MTQKTARILALVGMIAMAIGIMLQVHWSNQRRETRENLRRQADDLQRQADDLRRQVDDLADAAAHKARLRHGADRLPDAGAD